MFFNKNRGIIIFGDKRNGLTTSVVRPEYGTVSIIILTRVWEVAMLGAGAFTESFRSALNGFNRTDVVQFIQRQTVEHEKAMRLLREENARLKQAAAAPAGNAEQLTKEKQALEASLAESVAMCSALQEQIAALTAENQELKDSLATALAEAEAAKVTEAPAPSLDRPIAPPAGMATAPSSFDEMELAAYRRAEQTERMARERAAASSERIQSVYRQAETKMNMTASDMNLLMDNLRNNCDQMQALMETARNILAESADSLKASAELSGVV